MYKRQVLYNHQPGPEIPRVLFDAMLSSVVSTKTRSYELESPPTITYSATALGGVLFITDAAATVAVLPA